MSLIDVDSWVTEYDACERLSENILYQIVNRDKQPRLSDEYAKISGNVRNHLRQFSTELEQLKVKLGASSRNGSVTFEELERRQRQIECLQSKLLKLQNRFRSTVKNERDDLLRPGGSGLWDNDDDEEPIGGTPNINDLRQQHVQILEDQNRGLDVLSESLSRQKNLASRLGDEVEQQNEIIDVLSDTMERTDVRVNSETRNVGAVGRQDKTCAYWVVIIILFVAICIVALL